MNARAFATGAAIFALSLFGTVAHAQQQEDPLAAELRKVVDGNVAAFNSEDLNASMAFVDSRSPDYDDTKASIESEFAARDLNAKVLSFVLMGHDDEFAVARVKQATAGKPGDGFANNVTDAIVLFHQENGSWKLWSQEIVGVTTTP
jgi:hypothetical protein